MPIIPEMRAIWDVLREQYQAVLGGNISPKEIDEIFAGKRRCNMDFTI